MSRGFFKNIFFFLKITYTNILFWRGRQIENYCTKSYCQGFPGLDTGSLEQKRLASLSPQLCALSPSSHCKRLTVAIFQGSSSVTRQSVSNQSGQVGPRAGTAKVSKPSQGFLCRDREGQPSLLRPPLRWHAPSHGQTASMLVVWY
jgi:hypothetical protein